LKHLTKTNQINMKNMFKFVGVAAVVLALSQTLQAVPITGTIGFTGRVSLDTTSAGTATEVVNWVNPSVNGTSGAFTVASGSVNFASPWFFNTPATSPINTFWTVGGFTFKLLSSWITTQGSGGVLVNGTGIVTGNGYDATTLGWSFTCQDPAVTSNPSTFTFSASAASVPDGGATVMLLGIALSGMALLRRKLTA
jgi:hypothetical protein